MSGVSVFAAESGVGSVAGWGAESSGAKQLSAGATRRLSEASQLGT